MQSQARNYIFYHINVCTAKPYEGVPVTCVVNANTLSDNEMKIIAREMSCNGTAFTYFEDKNLRIRYFNANGSEIDFSGYLVIAVLATLKTMRAALSSQVTEFPIETKIGSIGAMFYDNKYSLILTQNEIDPKPFSLDTICDHCNISLNSVNLSNYALICKKYNFLYFTAKDLGSLALVNIANRRTLKFMQMHNIAICIVTKQTIEKDNDLHVRCFTGVTNSVSEDIATLSAYGGLMYYCHAVGLIDKTIPLIKIEQGDFTGRRCRSAVLNLGDTANRVVVDSNAITIFGSSLTL